jgi:exopolyphosphatase/guanosine-5'-triphosphate,3'-diphosphate pyrophosphatase
VDLKSPHQIYGTGGNINKVHKLIGAGHMEAISLKELQNLRSELDVMSLDERVDSYQLKPDRADVIVPALNIYIYILEELKSKRILVPKIGLSDGMVYHMYQQEKGKKSKRKP